MITSRTRFIALVATALATAAGGVAAPAPAGAAPEAALAVASYDRAQVWLQTKPGDREQRELVYRTDPAATPRVLDVTVPLRNQNLRRGLRENLGMGLDGNGRLSVVMQSKRGLCWTRVTGAPRLRLVPGSTGRDTFPSLFRGRLAFSRRVGSLGTEVRVGSLVDAESRVVASADDGLSATEDTAVGAGGSVAFVTVREGGQLRHQVDVARPGGPLKRVTRLVLGEGQEGGLTLPGVSPDGRLLRVQRQVGDRSTEVAFSLPGGKAIL